MPVSRIILRRGNATPASMRITLDTLGIERGQEFIVEPSPSGHSLQSTSGPTAASRPEVALGGGPAASEEEEMAGENDVIEVYKDRSKKGEWRWRRIAPNGDNVGSSGEGYEDEFGGLRAAKREADGKVEVRLVTPVEEKARESGVESQK